MILRSLTKHVKDQNWFAVGLDFAIVVIGVFIGLQVANWNQSIEDKRALDSNLVRLASELEENILITEGMLARIAEGQADRNLVSRAVADCAQDPEATAAFSNMALGLTKIFQLVLIDDSLERLTRQDRFIGFLSPGFQDALLSYTYQLRMQQEIIAGNYARFWQHHIAIHPSVSGDFSEVVGADDLGLPLAEKISEVCKDPTFRNRLVSSLGWLSGITRRVSELNIEIRAFSKALALQQQSL